MEIKKQNEEVIEEEIIDEDEFMIPSTEPIEITEDDDEDEDENQNISEAPEEQDEDDSEKLKLKNEISNLEKATAEELRKIRELKDQELHDAREERKAARKELISRIDEQDDSVKVWNAKIEESVAPTAYAIEQQKAETFDEAFEDFATAHPMSRDMAEKVMKTYSKLQSSSGLNKRAVMKDIAKAYRAESGEDNEKIMFKANVAEKQIQKSSPAISKGNPGGSGVPISNSSRIPQEEYNFLRRSGMKHDAIIAQYNKKK